MKLMIAGSRGIKEFDFTPYVSGEVEMIITGGATGIDAAAECYADEKRISKLILRPDYARFGKGAPLKRNEEMVDMADCVLVIWDGESRGSLYTANYAKRKGKPLTVITVSK